LRYVCRQCGGTGICEHGRQRRNCNDCKGTLNGLTQLSKPAVPREPNAKASLVVAEVAVVGDDHSGETTESEDDTMAILDEADSDEEAVGSGGREKIAAMPPPPPPPPPHQQRKCGNCGEVGHYRTTCPALGQWDGIGTDPRIWAVSLLRSSQSPVAENHAARTPPSTASAHCWR